MLEDAKLLETTKRDWMSKDHQVLDMLCTKPDLDKEVEWFGKKLTEFLKSHAKIIQITSYSKRWWDKEVAKARAIWAKDKRRLDRNEDLREEFKQAQNRYFRIIKKAKRKCWQKFLQGESQSLARVIDKNHDWTALKYTKPLQFETTPALKDSDGNTVVSIRAKEALVRKSAFPKPPTNVIKPLRLYFGSAHTKVTEEVVA